jgi:hypothetical protein
MKEQNTALCSEAPRPDFSTGFGLSKIGKWLPLDEKPCPEASISEAGKVLIKRQSGAPWARAHPDAYHQI